MSAPSREQFLAAREAALAAIDAACPLFRLAKAGYRDDTGWANSIFRLRDTLEKHDGKIAVVEEFLLQLNDRPMRFATLTRATAHDLAWDYAVRQINGMRLLMVSSYGGFARLGCPSPFHVGTEDNIRSVLPHLVPRWQEGPTNDDFVELYESVRMESAKAIARFCGPPESDAATIPTLPKYVTLDQMAAFVSRSKRTLEKLKNRAKNPFPPPDVKGGGGRPDEWAWPKVRLWLEREYGRKLPEHFPRTGQLSPES
jgi:hypothetical protein